MKKVQVIQITQNGSDKAVFLGGEYVYAADPSTGDDVDVVDIVAHSLASIHGVEVEHIEHSPCEDWEWDEISALF